MVDPGQRHQFDARVCGQFALQAFQIQRAMYIARNLFQHYPGALLQLVQHGYVAAPFPAGNEYFVSSLPGHGGDHRVPAVAVAGSQGNFRGLAVQQAR